MEDYFKLPDDLHHIIDGFAINPYSLDRLAIMEQIRIIRVINLLESIPAMSRSQQDLILNQVSSSKTISHLYDDAVLGTDNFVGLKVGPRVRIRTHFQK